jgi:hypothetical protein
VYRQNLNAILHRPVDHPIIANNEFPDVFDPQLRNYPAHAGKGRQSIGGVENPVRERRLLAARPN